MEELIGVIPSKFLLHGKPELLICESTGEKYLKYRLHESMVLELDELYGYDESNQWEVLPLSSPRLQNTD